MNPLKYYEQNKPSEWSFRTVAQADVSLLENAERANVITELSRTKGLMLLQNNQVKEFHGLELSFDINTEAQNTAQRFDEVSIQEFFKFATHVREDVINNVEMRLNGK